MTQCYGSCAKSAELAGMSSTLHDWDPSATLEKVRSGLWDWMKSQNPCRFRGACFGLVSLASVPEQGVQSIRGRAFSGSQPRETRRGHSLHARGVFQDPQHQNGRLGHHQRLQKFWDFPNREPISAPFDDHGPTWYAAVARWGWESQWKKPVDAWSWLGLLPGYLGREDASLLHMVSDFMTLADGSDQGMLMHDHDALMVALSKWADQETRRPLVLFGVTWAVLDWVEALRMSRHGSRPFRGTRSPWWTLEA